MNTLFGYTKEDFYTYNKPTKLTTSNINWVFSLDERELDNQLHLLKTDVRSFDKNKVLCLQEVMTFLEYKKTSNAIANSREARKGVHFDSYVAKKYLSKVDQAKDRGIHFDMSITTMSNLMKARKCYLSGIELTLKYENKGNPPFNYLTIDRIDNSYGYVKGNVRAVAHCINQLKGEWERNKDVDSKTLSKVFAKLNREGV